MQSSRNVFTSRGGIENEESINKGLRRELKEELGIDFDLENIEPFLLIKQYQKDYPIKRNNTKMKNRLLKTYYFLIDTNENVDEIERALTKSEIEGKFSIFKINISDIKSVVINNETDNPKNKYFVRELLRVLDEFMSLTK